MRTQYYWRTREHSIIKGTAINEPTIKRGKKGIIKEEQEFNKGLELEKQWRTKRWTKINPACYKKKIKNQSAYNVVIFNKGYNCYN